MTVSRVAGTPLSQDLPNYIDLVLNFSPVLDPTNTPTIGGINFAGSEIDLSSIILNTTCIASEINLIPSSGPIP